MKTELCAYCGKHPVDPAWCPFCSERCKMADLGRWLSEAYRIPGSPADPFAEPDEPPVVPPLRNTRN